MKDESAQKVLDCIEKLKLAFGYHAEWYVLFHKTKPAGPFLWPAKLYDDLRKSMSDFDAAAEAVMPMFVSRNLDASAVFRLVMTRDIANPRNIEDEVIDAQATLRNLYLHILGETIIDSVDWVSRSEAGRLLDVNPSTITRWTKRHPEIAETDQSRSRVSLAACRALAERKRARLSRDEGIRDRARQSANRDARQAAKQLKD